MVRVGVLRVGVATGWIEELWKVLVHDLVEVFLGFYFRHMGSKVASTMFVLSVAACEFSHKHGAFVGAESVDDERVVMQHARALLVE